jgi:hypothetical protein
MSEGTRRTCAVRTVAVLPYSTHLQKLRSASTKKEVLLALRQISEDGFQTTTSELIKTAKPKLAQLGEAQWDIDLRAAYRTAILLQKLLFPFPERLPVRECMNQNACRERRRLENTVVAFNDRWWCW